MENDIVMQGIPFDLNSSFRRGPAFAPGVSHCEPGGMTTREVMNSIQKITGQLVGADIVEYNPAHDPQGITGMVAAMRLKEILGKMLGE
ncbi:MAG: hypothetical protein GY799_13460 [Desulfobulbaceae bacterium]|nr:hypothetical protein [Desulfobulbaceae bacterium]